MAPTKRPPFDLPLITVDFLLPIALSSRNFEAYKKSSNAFCFVFNLPALCQAWHNAGRLNTKQNAFDDFLYASKFLEDNAIGNRKSTVISGRSNGGLLVGATLIQNPNYFGAALPAVGVMDMIRFTEFTEGLQ